VIRQKGKNKRQLGGLFLEAVMFLFLFAYSWTESTSIERATDGKLTIHAIPAEHFVFRDAGSSPETLIEFISKVQTTASEFASIAFDIFSTEILNSEALIVSASLFNTFYTHLTANAP
jgi:hypothetical protein